MNFMDGIPTTVFEILGTVAGGTGCVVIAIQLAKEYKDKEKSSLSMIYVLGMLSIAIFWALYGIRFRSFAIGVTNSISAVLLAALLYVVVRKASRIVATPAVDADALGECQPVIIGSPAGMADAVLPRRAGSFCLHE